VTDRPAEGSVWLDTGARNVPESVRLRAYPDSVLRRVVVVERCLDGRNVEVCGQWQEKIDDQWLTVAQRRTWAGVETFGRRYQRDN
jgi:hypothetical protein